jgi:MFS family permease
VALSQNIPQIMICRVLQALGSSGALSVGTAVLGDIYKLEERGTAIGIFHAVRSC